MMAGHINPQSLYTIEQIELMRRLRNSGITKEQLLQAFESFDRIDRELGHIYTIPVSFASPFPAVAMGVRPVMTPVNMSQAAQAVSQAMSKLVAAAQQNPPRKRSADSNGSAEQPVTLPTATEAPEVQNGVHNPNNHIVCGNHGNMNSTISDEMDELENSEEFREFNSKGDIACCEEIRNFILQYNIKQQQIATLSGISQSYVSRYLKGDFFDMSERSKRAIQKWYIIFRKNPAAIGPAANAAMLCSPSPVKLQKFVEITSPNEFVNYPRRERFVFRPSHLEVLERYFQDDSYPSQEKREEIARACNAAVDVPPGRVLGDRETVTPQIVSNWFANKRKEMKKIAREEGLDISQVPLRGRGRPSRFTMDLAALGDQSNNSQMSDSNEPNTVGMNLSANYPAPDKSSSQSPKESEMNPEISLANHDDQTLSLAVEMAAVNQAIIALSGQNPITVKTEKPDPSEQPQT